ncbi:YncE family protein [Solihabitans fulvus]|nr:YncE family protein [Solihabitans fulvus]
MHLARLHTSLRLAVAAAAATVLALTVGAPSGSAAPPARPPVHAADITITPPGVYAYVADNAAGTVSVVDTATGAVTGTIHLDAGTTVQRLIASPDGLYLYALTGPLGRIQLLDPMTSQVIGPLGGTAEQPHLPSFSGMELSPDGKHLYGLEPSNGAGVFVAAYDYDTTTFTLSHAIPTRAMDLAGVAFSPDSSRAYLSGGNSLMVVDTASGTVTTDLDLGHPAGRVALSPDGLRLAMIGPFSSRGSWSITMFDAATLAVTGQVPLGPSGYASYHLVFGKDGRQLYVAKELSDVAVVDTASNTVTTTIPVGVNLGVPALAPDGRRLYADTGDALKVIDTATNAVTGRIPSPQGAEDDAVAVGTVWADNRAASAMDARTATVALDETARAHSEVHNLNATLTGGGAPIAGQTVVFVMTDRTLLCTAVTDSNGHAACDSSLYFPEAQRLIAEGFLAEFWGSANYLPTADLGSATQE